MCNEIVNSSAIIDHGAFVAYHQPFHFTWAVVSRPTCLSKLLVFIVTLKTSISLPLVFLNFINRQFSKRALKDDFNMIRDQHVYNFLTDFSMNCISLGVDNKRVDVRRIGPIGPIGNNGLREQRQTGPTKIPSTSTMPLPSPKNKS